MRYIRVIVFIFYKYYLTGRFEYAPHFHAIVSTSILFTMNISSLLFLFDDEEILFKAQTDKTILNLVIVTIVLAMILALTCNKIALKQIDLDNEKLRRGGKNLLVYIITSIGSFFFFVMSNIR